MTQLFNSLVFTQEEEQTEVHTNMCTPFFTAVLFPIKLETTYISMSRCMDRQRSDNQQLKRNELLTYATA